LDDRAALLANVLNVPSDDTVRLVLADWLDERGEEDLGRFVRVGVVAARAVASVRPMRPSGPGVPISDQNVSARPVEFPGAPLLRGPKRHTTARGPVLNQSAASRADRPPALLSEELPVSNLTKKLVSFLKADDGPTAVEYAVMLALIIVVCIAAITTLGSNANSTFSFVGSSIQPPSGS
jgi:pilus assembly protein Flp/PilA